MKIRVLPQHLTITGALALALCLLTLLAAGSGRAEAQVEDARPGQIIVRLNADVDINQFLDDYPSELKGRLGEDLLYNLEDRDIYLLETTPGTDVEDLAENLLSDTRVNGIAEPNFIAEAPEDPTYEDVIGVARMRARDTNDRKQHDEANDTYATNLNLDSEGCERDIKGATVAVLDTGAYLKHPRLEANFKKVKRYDFVDNDGKPSEARGVGDIDGNGIEDQQRGHGTHVAGIVDQVAPGAKIMPLRVLDPEGYGDAYTVARAISFALMEDHEADVINLSLGTSEHSKLLEEMVEEATDNGIVVAAAAGNEDTEEPHYPAAGDYPIDGTLLIPPVEGLLAVTSVDENEVKSEFANYGYWVGIAAPGDNIRSTFLRGKYATWSGTSMATPFVSGQAALIRAHDDLITSVGIEEIIRDSASVDSIDFYANNPGYALKLGAGHANVCGSLPDPEG